MEQRTILLIDDDASLLRVMEHHLTDAGYRVIAVADGNEGLAVHAAHPADAIFTDLKMSGMSGLEFITAVRESDAVTSIVVITGFPTVNAAVEAMKAGALDFIQKPVDREHLLAIARKAVEVSQLRSENLRMQSLIDDHLDFGNMIGTAPAMQDVYRQGRQAAHSSATVMITGETGTGKEMLAKAIHNTGHRKDHRFIAVNCAAVPANLLESELFGHVRGSFTGAVNDRRGLMAEAGGGTFFLDEIGDMPLELQPKLLRVLQERTYQPVGSNSQHKADVRFVVATHHDLNTMVGNGTFREDLFFRLNVIPIHLPPIRERRDDILPLFLHFLREAAAFEKKSAPRIDEGVVPKLESYDWPGNVREIQNLAHRIVALHTGTVLTARDLPEPFASLQAISDQTIRLPETGIDLEEWIDNVVVAALKKNNWNQTKAAAFLNISRNTLVYRLDKRSLKQNEVP